MPTPPEKQRTVFFVSDRTGITAEALGRSLMSQFDGAAFRQVTLPFISDVDKANAAVARINAAGRADGVRPIVFSTIVDDAMRVIIQRSQALYLDFFAAFIGPLENELGVKSSHTVGRAHASADNAAYIQRIEAVNFALANDDGVSTRNYPKADVILAGVSRSGKTPTCLYLALQYGVFAANYPLTEDDLKRGQLPEALLPYRNKLYGLTIDPERLQQIRHHRRPNSHYSSSNQVRYEVRQAEDVFRAAGVPCMNTTLPSIEEIATTVLHQTGIKRRF
ncbi:MAG: kinase/pyrophosphorylase [Gammaproteobacteria bacterium]|nr:kinase/pyrophosphorylase [Gammaproteobacteria bacterium]MBU6508601.1 kinase/pyrophosphorylase [Gammaproteobacteria bacterium]MDE1983088.1 kinase/pyrophosphorylase [Gammaproteobacteria bacterium]MDE2107577.1 kinase/pyrophosphorylase [Gammaproteobacteria bacterium]MDE2459856.1 kinase/pyrophosphorylase [Gammaproteobacteria bacterium]